MSDNSDLIIDVKFRSAGSRSHTRGSMTLKQTEGWLLLSSAGCPRLHTRQNLLHEGSTIGDALIGVSVPIDELFNCNNELFLLFLLAAHVLLCTCHNTLSISECVFATTLIAQRSKLWRLSVEKKKTCLKDGFFTSAGRLLTKDEASSGERRHMCGYDGKTCNL